MSSNNSKTQGPPTHPPPTTPAKQQTALEIEDKELSAEDK